MSALDRLQTLEALYERMLELAVANDWHALAALGVEATALRNELAAGGALSTQAEGQDEALRHHIQTILALDEKIREHTVPCLESTRKLLAGVVLDNNVRKAYAALG